MAVPQFSKIKVDYHVTTLFSFPLILLRTKKLLIFVFDIPSDQTSMATSGIEIYHLRTE